VLCVYTTKRKETEGPFLCLDGAFEISEDADDDDDDDDDQGGDEMVDGRYPRVRKPVSLNGKN